MKVLFLQSCELLGCAMVEGCWRFGASYGQVWWGVLSGGVFSGLWYDLPLPALYAPSKHLLELFFLLLDGESFLLVNLLNLSELVDFLDFGLKGSDSFGLLSHFLLELYNLLLLFFGVLVNVFVLVV